MCSRLDKRRNWFFDGENMFFFVLHLAGMDLLFYTQNKVYPATVLWSILIFSKDNKVIES
jgi:hypothetical protein